MKVYRNKFIYGYCWSELTPGNGIKYGKHIMDRLSKVSLESHRERYTCQSTNLFTGMVDKFFYKKY
jgi:hypothetical protein